MTLAVIPARSGSKRLPRKNIKEFLGKPMIVWTILAAIESNVFDRIIVSTDSEEIAEISRQNGADVPFLRPAELADDVTPTIPVIRHAIEWISSHGGNHDAVCCLYPAAPFISPYMIKRAYNVMKEQPGGFVFPVSQFHPPIQRALRMDSQGFVEMLDGKNQLVRTQDLEETYFDAGQFYWGHTETWISNDYIFTGMSRGIAVDRSEAVDIDTEEDWRLTEKLISVSKD